jgi:hypothetical protein
MSGSCVQDPIQSGVEIHRGYEPGLMGESESPRMLLRSGLGFRSSS